MKTLLLKLLLLIILLSFCTYQGVTQPTDCVPTSGDNATITFGQGVIPTFNGAPLPSGTYIIVVFNSTSGQKCAGFTTWQNAATAIAATGANGTFEGFAPGEAYKFRIQLPNGMIVQSNNITVSYKPIDAFCDNGGTYKKDGISCIQSFAAVITSSSEDLAKGDILNLSPNPTSGLIKITPENHQFSQLQILNIHGKLIQIMPELKDNSLDLSHLACGSYIVKGLANNYPFAKKLIIVR
ncbi:MAG: T9SS type A sorting domain-containing protein [Saprospiraceae bacterium]|nr:T9SS type A sorting domain-containing protein [Saprospiraceae bacterium]